MSNQRAPESEPVNLLASRGDLSEGKSSAPQPYLDADYGKELSYQLWVTKGARFNAGRRLEIKQRWSTYAITALALYAITSNLMTVYEIADPGRFGARFAFVSSVMSILILVISVLEGSRKYDLRASQFHVCALELAKLYRELRLMRVGPGSPADMGQFVSEITKKYEAVLDKYENHEDIDYYYMMTKKSEWFSLGRVKRAWIKLRWYLQTLAIYHVAIVVPPVVLMAWWLNRV